MNMYNSYRSSQRNDHEKPLPTSSWKCVNTLAIPSHSTPLVYRNKTVTYACLNMLRTWHWETNEEKSQFIPMERGDYITALAALQSNNLIMGTEKGKIYIEKNSSWTKSDLGSAVCELLIIGPHHIIVGFKNGEKCLFDIKNGTKLTQFQREVQLCRFRENVFANLQGGCVEIKKVENFLEPDFSCRDPRFVAIRAEKGQLILLQHKDKMNFTIWDVEKRLFWEAPLNANIDTDQFQTLVLINSKTFIVPGYCEDGVYVEKLAFNVGQWSSEDRSIISGKRKVSSMIHADNYIIYTTDDPLGIHVFDMDLCFSFSTEEFAGRKSDTVALRELNGFVAIEFEKSVCIIKHQKHKRRLFVGEGDFSFTEAFIKKHAQLAQVITATEIKTRDGVEREFRDNPKQTLRLMERLISLEEKGVEIRYEIDARRLHEYFPSARFERIQWNCPFAEYVDAMSEGAFKDVILDFFDSSGKIQQPGDRVHVTLMQERRYQNVRQKQNPIVLGSATSGYRLVKKRFFGQNRYPGYEHMKSGGLAHHSSNDNEMREFVFEKVGFDKEFTIIKSHRISHYSPESDRTAHDSTDYYFECSTDEDSSDYGESSDDETGGKSYAPNGYKFTNGKSFYNRNSRTTNGALESCFTKSLHVTNSKFCKSNT